MGALSVGLHCTLLPEPPGVNCGQVLVSSPAPPSGGADGFQSDVRPHGAPWWRSDPLRKGSTTSKALAAGGQARQGG